MTSPAFTQITFRLRNDNGTETTATWKQAQNTNATINVDENFRVRFRMDETNSRSWSNQSWTLQYQKNGTGGYAAVTDSTPVKIVASSNFGNDEDCTTQLTGGTGTFVTDNNGMKDQYNACVNSGSAGYLFETEWSLQLDSAQMANGDYVDIRVTHASYVITYTNTPRATASKIAVSVSESVNVTDTPTMGGVPNIDVSDTVGAITDTPTVQLGPPGPLSTSSSESVAVTEGPRWYSETIIVTDHPTVVVVTPSGDKDINISESIGVTDTPTMGGVPNINRSESIQVTDTPTILTPAKNISVSDTVSALVDTPTINRLQIDVSKTESVGVTDTPTILTPAKQISVSESTGVTDVPTVDKLIINISVSESINVTDAPIVVKEGGEPPQTVSVSDTVAVTDYPWYYDDEIIVTDHPEVVVEIKLSVSDSIGVTDTPTVDKPLLNISKTESIGVADVPTVDKLLLNVSKTESIGVADTPTIDKLQVSISKAESVNVTDTPNVYLPALGEIAINVSEWVGVTDTPAMGGVPNISKTESIQVTDTPTLIRPTNISKTESIGVTDAPTIDKLLLSISKSESIGVNDNPAL